MEIFILDRHYTKWFLSFLSGRRGCLAFNKKKLQYAVKIKWQMEHETGTVAPYRGAALSVVRIDFVLLESRIENPRYLRRKIIPLECL